MFSPFLMGVINGLRKERVYFYGECEMRRW